MAGKGHEMTTRGDNCPREIDIRRALVGDLARAEKERVLEHVAACPRCAALVEDIEAFENSFYEKYPADMAARLVLPRLQKRLVRRRLLWGLVPAVAVAGLLVLSFVPGIPGSAEKISATRVKGEVNLSFHVKRGDGSEKGASGGLYRAGDRLQFVYTSGANRYVFLLSVEASGRVNNFNYRGAEESVAIEPGAGSVLEGSIVLDESPHPERIFAVFSNEALDWETIEQAAGDAFAAAGGNIQELSRLPLEHDQASVLLNKK